MLIHLKIVAWFHIIGSVLITLLLMVTCAFYLYVANEAPGDLDYAPVTEFTRMTPLELLYYFWVIVAGMVFGLGILRFREWARWLGLFIAFEGFVHFIYFWVSTGIQQDEIGVFVFGVVLTLALNGYILWVLLSKTVKDRCRLKLS